MTPLRLLPAPYMIALPMSGARERTTPRRYMPEYRPARRAAGEGPSGVSNDDRDEQLAEMEALDRHWAGLMARAQGGDQSAYSELLMQLLPVLRAIVRRQHRRPEQAEDVVQEILLTIHRVRHTYDPKRSFRAWAFTIARRRSIDAIRKSGRRAKHEEQVEQKVIEVAPTAEPEENPFADFEPGLAEAVADLPPGQRQAIELVKLSELSLAEAAEKSGVSAGALKVAVHRAMKTLRARLAGT